MARSATIFKTTLRIADIGRHYYDELNLTVARHPSETDEWMMVRVLAFALHGQTELQFSKGLSSDDEPDIWLKNLSGDNLTGIDLAKDSSTALAQMSRRNYLLTEKLWISHRS